MALMFVIGDGRDGSRQDTQKALQKSRLDMRDHSSGGSGGARRSAASSFHLALNLPRVCAGRHIFTFMTIARFF